MFRIFLRYENKVFLSYPILKQFKRFATRSDKVGAGWGAGWGDTILTTVICIHETFIVSRAFGIQETVYSSRARVHNLIETGNIKWSSSTIKGFRMDFDFLQMFSTYSY